MEKRKGSVNGLVAMSNKQQAEKSSTGHLLETII
jgi:hypothetical protein